MTLTKYSRRFRRRPQLETLEGRQLLSAGALDLTFGGTGMVSTHVSPGNDMSSSVAVQPDLKVVAYGASVISGLPNRIGVVRYNADGSLDASFGSGGQVIIGNTSTTAYGKGLALQGDGKIVLIGSYYDPAKANNFNDFEVVRLNADGSLDATFGGGTGTVVTAVTPQSDSALGLKLQADGKIVVVGQWYPGSSKTGGVEVVRYNADDSLDASFGSGGETVVSPAKMLSGTFPQVDSLAIDSGGRIAVVGSIPYARSGGSQYYEGYLLRLTTGGKLDTTFGSAGLVTMLPSGATVSEFRDVGLQSTGKIVAVAQNALVRYNADGSLDTTFGTNGFSPLSSQVYVWNPFVIAADDKIVVGCLPLVNGSPDAHTWVMRVLADGTAADPTFGQGGLAEAAFGVRTLSRGIVLAPDGKIVVASLQTLSFPRLFRIARFLGDAPSAPQAAIASGSTTIMAIAPDPTSRSLVQGDNPFQSTVLPGKRRQTN